MLQNLEVDGEAAAAFHRHLDECAQCRNNPFDLCSAGHILIVSIIPPAPENDATLLLDNFPRGEKGPQS